MAYIKAGLESKGDRVHVFTSPHLINVTERIQIAGKEISKKYQSSKHWSVSLFIGWEVILQKCIKIR